MLHGPGTKVMSIGSVANCMCPTVQAPIRQWERWEERRQKAMKRGERTGDLP